MLVELFQAISEQAAAAAGEHRKAVFVPTPDPTQQLIAFGETLERFDVPPPARAHKVETLDDLIAVVERFRPAGNDPTIWHNDAAVVAVLDEGRRDTVTLELQTTEEIRFLSLLTAGGKVGFTQAELVRLLRVQMADAGVLDYVPAFKQIQFSRSARTRGIVAHGDESLGRDVEAAIANADNVPERIILSIPIFENIGLTARRAIRLAVDVDMQTERFSLIALPGELAAALQRAQQEIGAWLTDHAPEGVSVFWGKP